MACRTWTFNRQRKCIRRARIEAKIQTHWALSSPGRKLARCSSPRRKLARCHTPSRGPPCYHQPQNDPVWHGITGHATRLFTSADFLMKVVWPVQASPRSRCAPARAVQLSTMRNDRPLMTNWPVVTRRVASALAGGEPATRSGVKSSRRCLRCTLTKLPPAASSAQESASCPNAGRTGAVPARPLLRVMCNFVRCR